MMTKFSNALEKWWNDRSANIKMGKRVDPITVRGVFYLLRKTLGPRALPKKGGFYSALEKLEERTKITREDLKIFTEPKISLVTREGEKPILNADLSELETACALIYLEKTTIVQAIETDKAFTDRGIYIIKGMGFSTRDAQKIIKKAKDLGVPILTLTDMDPSGFLIDESLKKAGIKTSRLGIDLDLINKLGLKISDVNETLPRSKSNPHFKYLKKHYPHLAKDLDKVGKNGQPGRVEIDSVFALAGKDRFIEEILKRADMVVTKKAISKSIHLEDVPEKVDQGLSEVQKLSMELFAENKEKLKGTLDSSDRFTDFRLSEKEKEIKKAFHDNSEQEVLDILEDAKWKLEQIKARRVHN